jgi:hypothetical protein
LALHVEAGKGDVSVRWIKVRAVSEGNATSDLLLTVYVDKEGMDTTIIPEPPCMLLVAMLMAGLVTSARVISRRRRSPPLSV